MKSKAFQAMFFSLALFFTLVYLAGCGTSGGDSKEKDTSQISCNYSSLENRWNYTGRFDSSDGSYEDHSGQANVLENINNPTLIDIVLNDTWQHSNGNSGSGTHSISDIQMNDTTKGLTIPEHPIRVRDANGLGCPATGSGDGRWTDFCHMYLTLHIEATQCTTPFTSEGEFTFTR